MTNDPQNIIHAWDAFSAATERVPLQAAKGRLAASTIRQYPPGIPEIIPGMQYSSQTIDTLETAHAAGSEIIGVDMGADRMVEVLAEKPIAKTKPDIRTYDAQSLTPKEIDEIADYFRQSFCTAPYFHFAFHESDPLQSLPHSLDFEAYTVSLALSDPEKRKACQETLRGAAYQRAMTMELPDNIASIILPKGFHLWTDKAQCRDLMQDRCKDPGYITLVRDSENGDLLGLLHARMGTVEQLFYSEEWSNPLLFSQYQDESLHDDPERFFKKMAYHFDLNPADSLMTISAQVLNPVIQGGNIFYEMMRSMAQEFRPEHMQLCL